MADRALDSAGTQSARAMDLLKRSGKAQSADNLNRAYLAQLREESDDTAIPDMLDRAVNGGETPATRSRVRGAGGNPAPVVTGNQVTGQAAPTTPSADAPVTAPTTPGSAPAAVPTANGTPVPVEDAALYGASSTGGTATTTASPASVPLTAEESETFRSRGNPSGSPLLSPNSRPEGSPGAAEDQIQYDALGNPMGGSMPGASRPAGPAADTSSFRQMSPYRDPPTRGAPVVPGDVEAGGDPMRLEAPPEQPMANPTAGSQQVPDVSSPQTQALIQREAANRGVDPKQIEAVLAQWQANPAMMQSQLSGMLGEVNNPGVSRTPPTSPQVLELDAGRANPTVSPLDLLGAGRAAGRGIANLVQRGVASNDPVVAPGFNPAPGSQSGPTPAGMDQLRQALGGGQMGPPRPPGGPVSSTATGAGPVPVGAIPPSAPPAPMPSGPMPTPARASSLPMSPHIPRPAYQPNVPPINPNPGPPLAGPQGPTAAQTEMLQMKLQDALRTGANARNRMYGREANRKQYGTPQ